MVSEFKEHGRHGVSFGDCVFGFFGMSIMSVLCALMLWLISSLVCAPFAEVHYVVTETKEITALNDNSSATGSFFLGSGRVDEDMKYYYVEQTEKGKHIDDVSADHAYIIEANNETPRIERYEPKFENAWLYWIAFPVQEAEYKIYIPEDSITTDFDVNLE